MKYLFWTLKKLSILLLLALVGLIGYFVWIGYKNIPPQSGNEYLPGLKEKVEVHKDNYGIPHIIAYNMEDAYFALGYLQASERAFQIQILKRLVAGRIAEILGVKALEVDKLFRTLGFRRNSAKWIAKNYSNIDSSDLTVIQSYLKGLNAFSQTGNKPVEMVLLGMDFEPISLEDMMAVVAFIAYGFSEGVTTEPALSHIESIVGEQKLKEIIEDNYSRSTFVVESAGLLSIANQNDSVKDFLSELGLPQFLGSNAWVIGPSRSKTGFPILSNDPHIFYTNPSIWFEAYLEYPNQKLYGFFLPMVPFAMAGRTPNIAWGITMFPVDDLDFYIERLNPKNQNQIYFQGKLEDLKVTEETIKVRLGNDEIFKIREGRHGVLVDTIHVGTILDTAALLKKPISLKWSFFDDSNNPLKTFGAVNRANNLSEFQKNLSYLISPGVNLLYSDKQGNIAYWGLGGLYQKDFLGMKALDGESGKWEWKERLAFDQYNPKVINPPNGVIFNSNNRPSKKLVDKVYGYWQADDRANRLAQIFSGNQKFSVDDVKNIVMDNYFESADWLLKDLFENVKDTSGLNLLQKMTWDTLKNWDKRADLNSNGAAVFSEFRFFLAKEIFYDEIGESAAKQIFRNSRIHHYLKRVVLNSNSTWWDNIGTKRKESREDIYLKALELTSYSLMQKTQKKYEEIIWSDLHLLELKHPIGFVPPFHKIFNVGPYTVGGGRENINNQISIFFLNDHKPVAGPSMRHISDLSTDDMYIVNTQGNSGHAFSPNFSNQNLMFRTGLFRKKNFNQLKEGTVLFLRPR